jgi:hypothetical protein
MRFYPALQFRGSKIEEGNQKKLATMKTDGDKRSNSDLIAVARCGDCFTNMIL